MSFMRSRSSSAWSYSTVFQERHEVVQAPKDAKAHEKAEDPIFVLEHGIPIDSQHYLEHHLKLPLTRLFEPLMKNSNELLSGQSHTLPLKACKVQLL